MRHVSLKPILNTSLPSQFRQIRLQLARESGHPEGDSSVGYIVVAPLDEMGKIDPMLVHTHSEACRVVRMRPREEDMLGHLVYQKGGSWAFHYDSSPGVPDDSGFQFAEHFVAGEYVSINEGGKAHTYRVASVSHL
jgi:hypothetical protein